MLKMEWNAKIEVLKAANHDPNHRNAGFISGKKIIADFLMMYVIYYTYSMKYFIIVWALPD